MRISIITFGEHNWTKGWKLIFIINILLLLDFIFKMHV